MWSPDGAQIAYFVRVDQINSALTVANADGSDPRIILTVRQLTLSSAAISP